MRGDQPSSWPTTFYKWAFTMAILNLLQATLEQWMGQLSFASGPPYGGNPGGQFSQYSPNPYNTPNQVTPYGMPGMPPPPPSKPSRTWLWILLFVGGGGLLFALCCGGMIGGSVYYAMSIGSKQVEEDPVVIQQCGEIESVTWDIIGTGEEAENYGEDVIVFRVKGSKASGRAIGITGEGAADDTHLFREGELVLDSGERFPIFQQQ